MQSAALLGGPAEKAGPAHPLSQHPPSSLCHPLLSSHPSASAPNNHLIRGVQTPPALPLPCPPLPTSRRRCSGARSPPFWQRRCRSTGQRLCGMPRLISSAGARGRCRRSGSHLQHLRTASRGRATPAAQPRLCTTACSRRQAASRQTGSRSRRNRNAGLQATAALPFFPFPKPRLLVFLAAFELPFLPSLLRPCAFQPSSCNSFAWQHCDPGRCTQTGTGSKTSQRLHPATSSFSHSACCR